MSEARERLVTVGRVGRAHGRDGGFWVENALPDDDALIVGAEVEVGGRRMRVERRAGSAVRPLLALDGVGDRAQAAALRGEAVQVSETRAPLGAGEWLAEDLVGLEIEGLGEVRRVLAGTSCDLLEVGEEGVLVPFVSDAVRSVDVARRRIEVDRDFLGLGEDDASLGRSTPPTAAGGR